MILCRIDVREGLMRPRERRESGEQDLFRSRLDQVINMEHALVKLARTIDWRFLAEKFDAVYKNGPGQPPLPTRLMACALRVRRSRCHSARNRARCS